MVGAAGAVVLGVSSGDRSAAAAGAVSVAPASSLVFTNYTPPESSAGAHTADEPSIGADWKTGAIMYEADLVTYRVNFDDAHSPAAATWTDVSSTLTSQKSLDPILFTDPATGRTFVSQLAGQCSLSEFSDDDGASWTPSEGCGPPSGVDHQSVGGGPFALLPTANPVYADAVYYCSQGVATAFCAMSADGGLTYAAGVPIYSLAQCGGLHGHVRVAPDGTAIVPNQNCDPTPTGAGVQGTFGNQAAIVSTTNGATWSVSTIPDSVSTTRSDPAAAADSGGRWYFAYESAVRNASGTQVGGHAMLSTSSDDGTSWSPSVDVGAALGVRNVTFPEVIAGDPGRAAYAFLGSTTAGDPESQTFKGLWYLYIALTYDGGSTWTVKNLTPGDPVERGCIYLAGSGDCPNPSKRNLLDFMDIIADSHGRVLVGYADGCTGTCDRDQSQPCGDAACDAGPTASSDRLASIARLTCGRGLVAAQDSALACASGAAVTAVTPPAQPSGGTLGLSSSPPAPSAIPNTSGAPTAGMAGGLAAAVCAGLVAGVRRRRRRREVAS